MIEWHHEELSSYDLLVILEFMPERSAFRAALRSGEYSSDEITWRHIANEIARLRATMHAVHGGQRYDPPLMLSRGEMIEEAESMAETEDRREDFFSFADRDPFDLADAQGPLEPDDDGMDS